SADRRHANRDPCLLRLLVIGLRRRLLLTDDTPHFVRHALVRGVQREREVGVLAQAGVKEDARRVLPALFAAIHRVVVALRTDWQNPFVPGGRRCRTGHRFDGRGSGRGLEEREYKRDQRKSRIAHCGMQASIYRPADELQRIGPSTKTAGKTQRTTLNKWPVP